MRPDMATFPCATHDTGGFCHFEHATHGLCAHVACFDMAKVGYGMHCSMRGALEDYKQEVAVPDNKRRRGSDKLRQACQLAFDAVLDAFRGKGAGVEAIEADPDVPKGKNQVLASGAASSGLSNSGHCDVRDGSCSMAVWTTSDSSIVYAKRRWWFLMPRNGLAIELGEGVAVSWDRGMVLE